MDIKEGYIITEDSNKNVVLKNNSNKILNYTFLNLNSLIENLTFKVDKEAIAYLSINDNIDPSIAKMYVDKLKYESIFYDNYKLNYLKSIKKRLEDNNFIIYNDIFINHLKTTPITFLGYLETGELKFALNILDKLNIKYELLNVDDEKIKIRDVYKFNNIANESRFVFNEIKKLLDNNISINKIKIANYSSEYDYDFKRLSSYYHIPINFEADKNILSTSISKMLFELLNKYNSFDEIIKELKNKYSKSPYLKKIINIINSYKLYHYDPIKTIKILKYELKKIPFNKIIYENGIELIDIETYASQEDEYIFYLGFNLGSSPKLFKDTDYLDDKILKELKLDTSNDLNKYAKEDLIRALNRNTNLIITYKLKDFNSNYIPSSLINELGYKENEIEFEFGLNENEDKVIYSIALDEFNKFGTVLNNFKDSIYDINYLKYDNKFKGISKDKLNKHLGVIKLSYTSLSSYYECPFEYYLNYVLNVPLIYKNVSADLGTYTHEILENSYKEDFEFEKYSNLALKNIEDNLKKNHLELTDRDLFFVELFKALAKRVIEFNTEHESNTSFNKVLREPKLEVKLKDGMLIFEGKVDKILYNNDSNNTIFAIIDYKTGNNIDLKLSNLEDGLHTQLPIYYYLVKNSNIDEIKNPSLIGIYYHQIRVNDEGLKLSGYTKKGIENYHIMENNVTGTFINGLKVTKNEVKCNNVIDNDDIKYFESLILKLLNDAYINIRNGKFDISPKECDKEFACTYCKMKDICFKKYEDIVRLEKKPFKKEDTKDAI